MRGDFEGVTHSKEGGKRHYSTQRATQANYGEDVGDWHALQKLIFAHMHRIRVGGLMLDVFCL
jgi:hypothetical protein